MKTRDDSDILCGTGGCWKPRPRLKHYAHRLSQSQAPTLGSRGGTVTRGALLASGGGGQMEGCGFGARARGHSPFSLCKKQAATILAFFNSTPTWINVNLNRSGGLCWKPTHSIPPTLVTFSMNSQTCPYCTLSWKTIRVQGTQVGDDWAQCALRLLLSSFRLSPGTKPEPTFTW